MSKGKMCYYCHRVHELKYGKFSRQQLKEHVHQEKDGERKELVRFTALRDNCVELRADDGVDRLIALAQWEPPAQVAQQTEQLFTRSSRR